MREPTETHRAAVHLGRELHVDKMEEAGLTVARFILSACVSASPEAGK